MAGDVEVADTEGEVHRVDVFEGFWKRRQVRQHEDEDQGGDTCLADLRAATDAGRNHRTGFSRSASLRLPSR